jgi:hypothetical protein
MTLQDAANIANIAQLGVTLILASGGSILAVQYVRTMRPVWKRFARNVKREVAVILLSATHLTQSFIEKFLHMQKLIICRL